MRVQGAIKAAVVAHEQGDQATVQQVLMQAIHKAAPDAPDVGTPSPVLFLFFPFFFPSSFFFPPFFLLTISSRFFSFVVVSGFVCAARRVFFVIVRRPGSR